MNVLCVYSVEDYYTLERPLPSFAAIPFGISYVAGALKRAGHSVSVFVATAHPQSPQMFRERLRATAPELLCLTAVSTQYTSICQIAREARKLLPQLRIVLGGAHATLNPQAVAKEATFDALCVGEGERAIVEYASCLDRRVPPSIPGLWLRQAEGGAFQSSSPVHFEQDLDGLPFMDRSLWKEWIFDANRMHSVLAGRGCPNRCAYCSNHALHAAGAGKYLRFRSPANVVMEIEQIAANYPKVESIYIEIETFSAKESWADDLCSQLERFRHRTGSNIVFGTNLAPSKHLMANLELPLRMKRAHFGFVNLGLESGSERIRNEVLRRPAYTNKELVRICDVLRAIGIQLNLFVMLGIPGETSADYQDTIDCVRRCDPSHVFCSIFYPYPGTDLHATCRQLGLIPDVLDALPDPSSERLKATLDLPGFPKWRIQFEHAMFPYRVFKGRKSVLFIAAHMARTLFAASPSLNRAYRSVMASYPKLRLAQKRVATASK